MTCRGQLLDFNKPLTMGIINLTDDSFYAGSRIQEESKLLQKVGQMQEEGARFIDLGACSTRPGSQPVDSGLERERLVQGITSVKKAFPELLISADTFRADVAEAAAKAGADMINDVGCGKLDPRMYEAVAGLGLPYILMHNRGPSEQMKELSEYRDVVNDVVLELSQQLDRLYAMGVADVIIDPGFGFSKTVEQNFELLMRLDELQVLDCPILAGLSRKSMVWRSLNTGPEHALNGSTALHMLALERGAQLLRVHDVREASEAILLWERCRSYQRPV